MTNNRKKQKDNIKSLSPSRRAIIRRRKIKQIILITSVVMLLMSLVLIIFICRSNMSESDSTVIDEQNYTHTHTNNHEENIVQPTASAHSDPELKTLEGLWRYDQNTEYEFDGIGKGRMYYDKEKFFVFNYNVENNILALDFELEYVNDCKYSFTVENDKLTFIGGEGTAVIGKVYELTKVKK